MTALGFSAGLPFALLTGTINAWFSAANVDLAHRGAFVDGSGLCVQVPLVPGREPDAPLPLRPAWAAAGLDPDLPVRHRCQHPCHCIERPVHQDLP
jgi:hypothetical protein